MQNSKIKRMKDEEITKNIRACDKFLRVYKKGKCIEEFYCLFCDIAWKFHPKASSRCEYCVWEILEEEGCEDFSQRKFEMDVADMKRKKKWREARIPMLRRWKKILKVELARRDL